MAKRTPEQVYATLLQAGFTADQAVILTAISGGESGWDDTAIGDTALQNATWGPSIGLFQIRTLKAQTGSGSDRDLQALQGNALRQAQAAYTISNRGTNWTPWTVYTSGRWRDFLPQARNAAAAGGTAITVPGTGLAGATPTGLGNPLDVDALLGKVRYLGIMAGALTAGLALVVAGAYLTLSPAQRQRLRGSS